MGTEGTQEIERTEAYTVREVTKRHKGKTITKLVVKDLRVTIRVTIKIRDEK